MSQSHESAAAVAEDLKLAMRKVAQTVTVVSLVDDRGQRLAMTASSATSVSLDPPSMLVCINREASPHDHMITPGTRFCINVLADDMEEVSNLCAGDAFGDARFAKGDWQLDPGTESPYLADALVSLFCSTDATLSYGTHLICVGRVDHVRFGDRDRPPLVYAQGAYTSLASTR